MNKLSKSVEVHLDRQGRSLANELIASEVEVEQILNDLLALGLRIEPFTLEHGVIAGRLWLETRQAGLSLGA